MTKTISKNDLIELSSDLCVFMTKEDVSKVTRIIAQDENSETEYTVEKQITETTTAGIKKGYTCLVLAEKQ